MTLKKKFLATTVQGLMLSALTSYAFAHGEDKPGPHGGIIRMPSSYHVELVPETESSFSVYLLDIAFADPCVRDSSVKASLKQKDIKTNIRCSPQKDYFRCKVDRSLPLSAGTLSLITSRDGVSGAEQFYNLPLRPSDK